MAHLQLKEDSLVLAVGLREFFESRPDLVASAAELVVKLDDDKLVLVLSSGVYEVIVRHKHLGRNFAETERDECVRQEPARNRSYPNKTSTKQRLLLWHAVVLAILHSAVVVGSINPIRFIFTCLVWVLTCHSLPTDEGEATCRASYVTMRAD